MDIFTNQMCWCGKPAVQGIRNEGGSFSYYCEDHGAKYELELVSGPIRSQKHEERESRPRHVKKGTPCEGPAEEREQFIRDNAVAMVNERDELIRRLRKEIAKLNNTVSQLRKRNGSNLNA